MSADPMHGIEIETLNLPPARGPGSGKEAWVEAAYRLADANVRAFASIEKQSAVIRALEAENDRLRALASRKPKGGRARLEDTVVSAIRADLAAGLSTRATAARHGVSAMTVSRVRRSPSEAQGSP
ncbi:hypothetical protein [Salinarimonas rosea]|uniref:hypothetical protein n=1 Tax=Salinarimonas rosea TaxID=552063 RepID=UPI000400C8CB|nr:hypothetical protein [Salinarimonas rosea]